jgi:hypothetical protein
MPAEESLTCGQVKNTLKNSGNNTQMNLLCIENILIIGILFLPINAAGMCAQPAFDGLQLSL